MSGGAIAGGLIAGQGLARSGIDISIRISLGFFLLCFVVTTTTWGICKYLNYRDAVREDSE